MKDKASQPSSQRPRVVCHMTTSVDGRIVVDGWPASVPQAVRRHYDEIHQRYDADGWICGRVTMQEFAGDNREQAEADGEYRGTPRSDFVAPGEHGSFAFALDPSGRLAWSSNQIAGDHVVAILSERVSEEYLRFLRERGISYLLAGPQDIDLKLALEKIGSRFGVKTLLLEGGGGINGSLLHAGLIDELSLLIAPVADGRTGTAALFDIERDGAKPHSLTLQHVEGLADGFVWLRYRVDGHRASATTDEKAHINVVDYGTSTTEPT
jgi:2,5-diamino-6-(ribosylamino)-4(3H)-pyrimidinone 5'-phosphate reductase